MEGPISRSAVDRLPAAIKGLDETHQRTYIYLRLRKPEAEISRLLPLPPEETSDVISRVRSELIGAGQLDLIEDPRFLSIHAEDEDSREMPLTGGDLDVDQKLVIKEFLTTLKESISELPEHQSRLLKLRYKYQLSAKDILGFSQKTRFSPVPNKETEELREQDIFYGLNVALKDVFKGVKAKHSDISSFGIANLKYIFEEIGI